MLGINEYVKILDLRVSDIAATHWKASLTVFGTCGTHAFLVCCNSFFQLFSLRVSCTEQRSKLVSLGSKALDLALWLHKHQR